MAKVSPQAIYHNIRLYLYISPLFLSDFASFLVSHSIGGISSISPSTETVKVVSRSRSFALQRVISEHRSLKFHPRRRVSGVFTLTFFHFEGWLRFWNPIIPLSCGVKLCLIRSKLSSPSTPPSFLSPAPSFYLSVLEMVQRGARIYKLPFFLQAPNAVLYKDGKYMCPIGCVNSLLWPEEARTRNNAT